MKRVIITKQSLRFILLNFQKYSNRPRIIAIILLYSAIFNEIGQFVIDNSPLNQGFNTSIVHY